MASSWKAGFWGMSLPGSSFMTPLSYIGVLYSRYQNKYFTAKVYSLPSTQRG